MNSEHDKKKFRTELGLSSTVEREQVKDERASKANRILAEIGEANAPRGYTYMGSAAVHIFYNETLQHMAVMTQADGLRTHGCNELVAQAGLTDLMGTVMEKYGHKRPTKRNGF